MLRTEEAVPIMLSILNPSCIREFSLLVACLLCTMTDSVSFPVDAAGYVWIPVTTLYFIVACIVMFLALAGGWKLLRWPLTIGSCLQLCFQVDYCGGKSDGSCWSGGATVGGVKKSDPKGR